MKLALIFLLPVLASCSVMKDHMYRGVNTTIHGKYSNNAGNPTIYDPRYEIFLPSSKDAWTLGGGIELRWDYEPNGQKNKVIIIDHHNHPVSDK